MSSILHNLRASKIIHTANHITHPPVWTVFKCFSVIAQSSIAQTYLHKGAMFGYLWIYLKIIGFPFMVLSQDNSLAFPWTHVEATSFLLDSRVACHTADVTRRAVLP